MISAIILAAGESKRMGQAKLLLDIGGRMMIRHVAENVARSDVNEIIVVLGANSEEVKAALGDISLRFAFNDNYRKGMLSSVQCGVAALAGLSRACLVFQGDQPFIGSELIDSVISEYNKSSKGIVIPLCGGKRGHPLLFDSRYYGEVAKLDDKKGLRALSEKFRHDVREFETGDDGILRDIDTYKEYIDELDKLK